VVTLQRFPQPGETVIGDGLDEVGGGKGANQAMAAARGGALAAAPGAARATSPGAGTAFIGCVGRDVAGDLLVAGLERAGVRTDYVMRCSEPTGRAFIQVTPDGENSIVVMALANSRLDRDTVVAALDALSPAVVLCQLEIPLGTVEATARWTEQSGATFVLNPSPIRPLPSSLLQRCDPLIVNATEAEALLHSGGRGPEGRTNGLDDLAAAFAELSRSVVVTAGSRGAYVGTATHGISRLDGQPVVAVDTTGAGDEFAGQVAAGLARGLDLLAAADIANEAAARLVQVPRSERSLLGLQA
jgi:ribokinase